MWIYNTPVGTWVIRINRDNRYELCLGDNCFGVYSSAVAAADDVFTQHTGCDKWDDLDLDSIPTDIYEWEKR